MQDGTSRNCSVMSQVVVVLPDVARGLYCSSLDAASKKIELWLLQRFLCATELSFNFFFLGGWRLSHLRFRDRGHTKV